MAEVYTDTWKIRSHRGNGKRIQEIIEGVHDDIPEGFFLNVGTIDEVVERYKRSMGDIDG